jgi:predicted anti-sigma-YlaC factor YlaD
MGEHVRDDELMDAAEGTASAVVRRHVEACVACRERVAEAAAGWEAARVADVPEPSPFYWEAFRRQLGRRVGAERRWRLAAWTPALAAAAVLAVGIGLFTRSPEPDRPADTLPAWTASWPAGEEDAGLARLGALALVDADEVAAGCSGITRCLAGLSDEEAMALADALTQELGQGSDL